MKERQFRSSDTVTSISTLWLVMALPWESNFEEILSKNKSVYAVTGVWWSCMLLLIGSIRADIGTENIYLAGIQRFWRNKSRDSFSKGKTFLYGCLAPYQRIEAWWSQFRRVYADSCMYMQHFQELRESVSFASPWFSPRDTAEDPTGTQGWYNFVIFFFPWGREL